MSRAHRLDRARVVVVGDEVAANELEDRLHLLAHRREDELVAPDGVPAELALVGLDALGDEPPAPLGPAQRRGDVVGRLAAEGRPQLRVVADLVLHPPQRLDRVPVAVRRRVLQPPEQLLVDAAADPLHDRPQVERRRQLGEVQHPVDLPVAIVDVDGVLEERGGLGQAHLAGSVQFRLEIREIALHLGHQPVAPPVGEALPVDRQDDVEVGAHRRGEGRVARDAGDVARGVLGPLDAERRVGWDGRRVHVAVHVLGQPVHGERRPEPPEHVVAAEPPAADVEEHRADGVRDVQVVVDPEEVLLDLGVPVDGERVVPEELAEDLLGDGHRGSLQRVASSRPALTRRGSSMIDNDSQRSRRVGGAPDVRSGSTRPHRLPDAPDGP